MIEPGPEMTPADRDMTRAHASFAPAGHYRWKICGLLFFATTLNYMDRQVLALLKPVLQNPVRGIGMTEIQFAVIVSVFSAAYALGLLISGPFIDRVGTRIGYATALSIWTLAAMAHALVVFPAITRPLHAAAIVFAHQLMRLPGMGTAHWVGAIANVSGAVIGFGIARFVLGFGEAGNFPAAIKAVAEWFPRKERALATGIFNSGTNIGAMLAPFVVGFLLEHFGWEYAFLATSLLAMIWLALWLTSYRNPQNHPSVSPAELRYINLDPQQTQSKIPWSHLLPRQLPTL